MLSPFTPLSIPLRYERFSSIFFLSRGCTHYVRSSFSADHDLLVLPFLNLRGRGKKTKGSYKRRTCDPSSPTRTIDGAIARALALHADDLIGSFGARVSVR
jgi:hypothetical protein